MPTIPSRSPLRLLFFGAFTIGQQAFPSDTVSQYSVDSGNNHQTISQGVTGIGMLDRVSSSAFAKGSQFKGAILEYGAGSLRWPNAGHSNLLITHWDNDHTYYYENGYWKTGFIGCDYRWLKDGGGGGRYLDARTYFFYIATVNTPAMAMKMVGKGSQYALCDKDKEGDFLDGSRN